MSLVSLDGMPLIIVPQFNAGAVSNQGTSSSTLLDAANEACIWIGQVFTEDGGSHTIDTSGSSSIGWLPGAVTQGVGTDVKVGIAAVDTANGPAPRASNAANVISFDVSKTYSGSGISGATWTESVPDTGSKTIAHGDLVAVAVQMTARTGSDAVNVANCGANYGGNSTIWPAVTQYLGGTYAAAAQLPNCVITFSDGTLGFLYGSLIYTSVGNATTWNNTSGTKEYGNFFQLPGPVKVYGFCIAASLSGNTDIVLYSDPLGTPNAEKTVSVDLNTVGVAANRFGVVLFPSPYSTTANQPLAGVYKPSSATNITARYKTVNASAHHKSMTLGTNCYAINRNTGAFAAQNSNKDQFDIALLVGGFHDGAGAGGAFVIG